MKLFTKPEQYQTAGTAALFLALTFFSSITPVSNAVEKSDKRSLTIDDYESWRSIDSNPAISSDGTWVAYVIRYPDRVKQAPVLHVKLLESEDKKST